MKKLFLSAAFMCSLKELNSDMFDFTFGDRVFTVIGWEHTLSSEQKDTETSLLKALENASKNDCKGADQILNDFLDRNARQLKSARRTLQMMDGSNARLKTDFLGIEFPDNQKDLYAGLGGIFQKTANNILSLCPESSHNISNLLLVFPGPEYLFSKKTGIPLDGIDSNLIRRQSLEYASQDAMDFDPSKENLSAETRKLMRPVLDRANTVLTPPTEKEIEAIVRTVQETDLRNRLAAALHVLAKVIEGGSRRNVAIVRNLVNRKGRYIVVLGRAHLSGMKEEFANVCEAEKNKKMPGLILETIPAMPESASRGEK